MQWNQFLAERDGTTPCFARIGGVVGALILAGLEGYSIYRGQTIDAVAFATAWTMLILGTAGAARLKLDTEAPAS